MPIEDDLIQRTLAELSAALGRLERRPDPAAAAAARELLDRAYRRHLGVAGEVVRRLPSDQLLAVISTTGRVDGERAFLTAALIEVDAAMPSGEGAAVPGVEVAAAAAGGAPVPTAAAGDAGASLLRLRALDLYAEAGAARVGVADLPERVRRLRAALLEHVLPEASYARLLRYYLHEGRFAVAEDLLFEWLEEHGASAALRAAGEGLYEDLEAESDERLVAGELPRDELAEGRELFRRSLVR